MCPKVRRINGALWISIAIHICIFFSVTTLVSNDTKLRNAHALDLLLEVHHLLRFHILKDKLQEFQNKVNALLVCLIEMPYRNMRPPLKISMQVRQILLAVPLGTE
jgi:hypothetical protein